MILLLIENLKAQAGEQIFKRGVAYYSRGYIRHFTVTPLENNLYQIQATVQGTKNYGVNLTVRITRNQLKINSYCSCPYFWSDLCKHQVAVLYKFLKEEYPELTSSQRQKAPQVDGIEMLKQIAFKNHKPTGILKYELKGLTKLSGVNFRLRLISELIAEQEALENLIEDIGAKTNNPYLSERLLQYFSPFDRLILGQLHKICTRKDPEKQLIFFAKSRENLDFIITLLSNREVVLDDNLAEPLILGEPMKPRLVLQGDETHLQTAIDNSALYEQGFYHPELNYLVKDNVLHLIDTMGINELPPKFDIPSPKLGAFLFKVLPKLKQTISCEVPPALTRHQLNLIQPQINLDFDYDGEQIVCQPQITINDQIYHDKECLSLASSEPEYQRLDTNPQEWSAVDAKELQNFLKFLEHYNFKVSPEGLTIKEPDHLIKFITNGFRQIPVHWQVQASPNFTQLKIDPIKLDPIVEVNIDDAINWFEFKILYNLGGQTYTHQEILRMLRRTAQGEQYIQAGHQIFLVEPGSTQELLEKDLRSATSKQEHSHQELYNLLFYRQFFQEHGISIKGNTVYNQLEADISSNNLVEACELPNTLVGELRSYQKEGFYWLRFLYKYKFNGILADDMGLGKTIQVLTLLKSIPVDLPHLVVCPRSLIYNWAAEIDKFYPGTPYLVYHGTPEEREAMRSTFCQKQLIITTYDIVANDSKLLQDFRFNYCILDEAQHIKNHLTLRAKEVKRIKSKHRLVITGTPIENGLAELWSIFDFLMPGYLESQPKFTAKYVTPLRKSGETANFTHLKQKVAPFILRRRKEEVLTELPQKIITIQNVFMTKLQEDTYQTILEQLKDEIKEAVANRGIGKSHITILSALTKLRQVCNHPKLVLPDTDPTVESGKLEALMELINEATAAGHKMVVFSQFVKMLKVIETSLQTAGISYEYLDGSTRDRIERINHFNETPEIPVFLISLKAGGLGINLTSADIVIHVDPWWNPMVENQATDRVHRMGQKNQVMVYKLITRGTVEEKILQLQKRKRSIFDAVVENNQSPVNALTWDDVKELFEL